MEKPFQSQEAPNVQTELKSAPIELTIDYVQEMINKSSKNVLKKARLEINKQTQASQASAITVIGIFASVITFLTIEFQFLKTICDINQIIGFTLILWSLLLSFNLGLDYLIKSRIDKQITLSHAFFYALTIFFLGIGIFFICLNKPILPHPNASFAISMQ